MLLQAWEGRAYDYCMENLKNMGFPVDGLTFDPDLVTFYLWQAEGIWQSIFSLVCPNDLCVPSKIVQVIRGLVIDKERGNLVKADRFGYVKRAMHGTTMLSTRAVR